MPRVFFYVAALISGHLGKRRLSYAIGSFRGSNVRHRRKKNGQRRLFLLDRPSGGSGIESPSAPLAHCMRLFSMRASSGSLCDDAHPRCLAFHASVPIGCACEVGRARSARPHPPWSAAPVRSCGPASSACVRFCACVAIRLAARPSFAFRRHAVSGSLVAIRGHGVLFARARVSWTLERTQRHRGIRRIAP